MSPFRASPGLTENWRHFGFAVDDGVATVTFERPDKLNALTFDVYADLRDLLAELPQRGDARVLVITGTGRGFCSGGDVEEIIGELQRHGSRPAARVHAHDRRRREGAARVPAAGDRGGQRRRRGRRRGHRARERLPPDGEHGVARVPVHARRARRRGHGLRLPAAADGRARARHRAADARRQAAGRGGATARARQQDGRGGRAGRRGAAARAAAGGRPGVRVLARPRSC